MSLKTGLDSTHQNTVAQSHQASTPVTLATVKPSGSVQLAGRAANSPCPDDKRLRFSRWATAQGLDATVKLMLATHTPRDGGYADPSLQRLWKTLASHPRRPSA